jgi:2-hydroxychromene-2-carboxylate isomerase
MTKSEPSSVDMWFSIGSTYTYFAVMRADRVAAENGVDLNWRPFNVRLTISKMASGYRPFAGKPMKLAYMWRDMARRSERYGLSPNLPAPYSLDDITIPNRIAVVGMREGWGIAYAKEAYRRWFELSEPADKDPNITKSIEAAGADPKRVLPLADAKETQDELLRASEEAHGVGIFGAPSFVVDGEVFWGDDRLEDAIEWAKHGTLALT